LRLEVEGSVPEAGTAPGVRTPTDGAQPRPVKLVERLIALLARICVQVSGVFVDLPEAVVFTRFSGAAEREVPRPRMGKKVFGGSQHAACLEHDDLQALVHKHPGRGCAACARSNYDYVVRFCHRFLKIPLSVRTAGSADRSRR